MPFNEKPGVYTLKAVFDSGPLAGKIACEKKIQIVSATEADSLRDASQKQGPLFGQAAPALKVSRWTQGSPATLTQLRGKVVLLSFWATWCAPCVGEFPQLERFYQAVKSNGATVIALSVAGDQESLVKSIARRQRVTFPIAIDGAASMGAPSVGSGHGATFGAYKIGPLPRHVVIDQQGNVQYHGGSLEDAMRIVRKSLRSG